MPNKLAQAAIDLVERGKELRRNRTNRMKELGQRRRKRTSTHKGKAH